MMTRTLLSLAREEAHPNPRPVLPPVTIIVFVIAIPVLPVLRPLQPPSLPPWPSRCTASIMNIYSVYLAVKMYSVFYALPIKNRSRDNPRDRYGSGRQRWHRQARHTERGSGLGPDSKCLVSIFS